MVQTFGDNGAVSRVEGRIPNVLIRIEVGARKARAHGLLRLVCGSRGHGKTWESPRPGLRKMRKMAVSDCAAVKG